uniref:Uncharacterized protein n=1 Tax=Anopheles farauti TaxID=69004 RepID=A0A182QSZ7_9DIPT
MQQQKQQQQQSQSRPRRPDIIEVTPASGSTWHDAYCKVRKGLTGTEEDKFVEMGKRTQVGNLRLPLASGADSDHRWAPLPSRCGSCPTALRGPESGCQEAVPTNW